MIADVFYSTVMHQCHTSYFILVPKFEKDGVQTPFVCPSDNETAVSSLLDSFSKYPAFKPGRCSSFEKWTCETTSYTPAKKKKKKPTSYRLWKKIHSLRRFTASYFQYVPFLGAVQFVYPGRFQNSVPSDSDRSQATPMRRAAAGTADPVRVPAAQEHTPGTFPTRSARALRAQKGTGVLRARASCHLGQALSSSAFPRNRQARACFTSTTSELQPSDLFSFLLSCLFVCLFICLNRK